MRLIKNSLVLLNEELVKKDVLFDEHILSIEDEINEECETIDGNGLVLIPGLIDVHVHLRQPGYENKETIKSGTLAAAHGGFTTIMPMPNIKPYPNNVEIVKEYLELIKKDSVVNTLPYGTISIDESGQQLSDLEGMHKLGLNWFSDDGVGLNNHEIMKEALIKSQNDDFIIACHTEDKSLCPKGASVYESEYATQHNWLGISNKVESEPLRNDLEIVKEVGGKYHACHISCKESIDYLRKAKKDGLNVSAEVTAHHLLLENTDVKGPNWKMNPPLKSHEDRMSLIEALEDGTLDFIASDHAPHTIEDKNKDMSEAAFGIVSLETSFSLLYDEFVNRQKRWTLAQLVKYMSYKPAQRFNLNKKGEIRVGNDSDLVLLDLNRNWIIHKEDFLSKGKNTPFDGWSVKGKVVHTIVNGKSVWKESI